MYVDGVLVEFQTFLLHYTTMTSLVLTVVICASDIVAGAHWAIKALAAIPYGTHSGLWSKFVSYLVV